MQSGICRGALRGTPTQSKDAAHVKQRQVERPAKVLGSFPLKGSVAGSRTQSRGLRVCRAVSSALEEEVESRHGDKSSTSSRAHETDYVVIGSGIGGKSLSSLHRSFSPLSARRWSRRQGVACVPTHATPTPYAIMQGFAVLHCSRNTAIVSPFASLTTCLVGLHTVSKSKGTTLMPDQVSLPAYQVN